MRLLLTTDTVGGVWTFTRELTTELLRRGHSVALLSFGPTPSEDQKAWVLATGRQCKKRFFFRSRNVPLEWMQDNFRTWDEGEEAFVQLREDCPFDIDVLHASQFCWGALDCGYPIVVTAHSDVLSWAEARRSDGLPESAWLSTYERLVCEGIDLADVIAAPSAWMAETLRRMYRLEKQVAVVPNGRDLTPIEPATAKRQLRAVTAGRFWDEAKGLSTLRETHLPMPLLIAGDLCKPGDAVSRPTLPTRAEVRGALSERELLSVFAESSVYIAPSLYEPFGLAPLEAALCGCAVIVRNLPSLREVWDDGAFYFKSNEELEALLDLLAHDSEALEAARLRSQTRASKYTVSRMTDGYLQLYVEAIKAAEKLGAQRPSPPLRRPLVPPDPEPWNVH